VDYLGLVLAAHQEQTIGQIAYRALPLPGLDHLAPPSTTRRPPIAASASRRW